LDFSKNNRILLCKNSDKDVLVDAVSWSTTSQAPSNL
jgi:hypothetical protein